MPRPISLTISRAALRHNLTVVRQHVRVDPGVSPCATPYIWAVIKADAYGHGVEHAVTAFSSADGLAMLDLDEAVRCRQAGWTGPVLLLEGFFELSDLQVFSEYQLSAVVHSAEQLDMLERTRQTRSLDVWLKLNTGMNRLGFMPDDYRLAWQRARRLQEAGTIQALGNMTHFSRADDDPAVTRYQLQLFKDTTSGLPGPVSLCNSAATLTPSVWSAVSSAEQWVRPGICLYGATPFANRSASAIGLKPAQTLRSTLLNVRDLPAGVSIGYGHQFNTVQPTRTGVVACGYADGYPRLAGTGTPITVDGVATRILGRVSMDMLVADLTPVPHAKPGSDVILWGEGGPAVDEVAACAQTIGYELLCAVAPRVPRQII